MRRTLLSLSLVLTPAVLPAQHPGGGGAPATPPTAAKSFDFLIGQWDLEVRPTVNSLAARLHGAPRLSGTWKAWRAFDGWGIEDELRIMNTRGDLQALTHTMRVFDQSANRWMQSTLDVLAPRFTSSSAQWGAQEMVASSTARDADGKEHLVRVRFHDITANGFQWEQSRSYDGGKTWSAPSLRITAKRTAATAPR